MNQTQKNKIHNRITKLTKRNLSFTFHDSNVYARNHIKQNFKTNISVNEIIFAAFFLIQSSNTK